MDLGFQVVHSNGMVVHPKGYKASVNPKFSGSSTLAHEVSIGPQQTAVADVRIQAPLDNLQSSTGI